MTFTYDPSGLSVALYRIRLEIGDVDSSRILLQDEEIEQVISEKSTFNKRVAMCCRLICALFSGEPERYKIGNFQESQEQIYVRYLAMAERYEARGGGSPWAGSISQDYKDSVTEDTDLVDARIKRGMHDPP